MKNEKEIKDLINEALEAMVTNNSVDLSNYYTLHPIGELSGAVKVLRWVITKGG